MSFLLLLVLAAMAAAGVLLAFAVLAMSPPSRRAQGRSALDAPFQAFAEQVIRRDQRRGRPPLPERLERAGLRLRPAEYVMAQAGCGMLLALLALLRFGFGVVMLIALVLGAVLPGFYVRI